MARIGTVNNTKESLRSRGMNASLSGSHNTKDADRVAEQSISGASLRKDLAGKSELGYQTVENCFYSSSGSFLVPLVEPGSRKERRWI